MSTHKTPTLHPMLWLAAGGVGDNMQPGALIALFVFCALAAFEALAPVTGAFQHLGQVIASAQRITQIIDQQPEVTFVQGTGQNLTHLRGQYRQQLTAWLQGQAELTIFGASQRYREQLENTELSWHEAQRRQSDLSAVSKSATI